MLYVDCGPSSVFFHDVHVSGSLDTDRKKRKHTIYLNINEMIFAAFLLL